MTGSEHPLHDTTRDVWSALQPGTTLDVVKLAPDGSEVARYPGQVVLGLDDGAWIVVHAVWTHGTMGLDGLEFRAGDDLVEWFSPYHPINAFAVLTAEGQFKGWYANVTRPACLDVSTDPPILTWHDLYIDLVGLPDNTFVIRDDDELAASGLHALDPGLHEEILWARSEMIRRFEQGAPPFAAALLSLRNPGPLGHSSGCSVSDASKTGTGVVHPH